MKKHCRYTPCLFLPFSSRGNVPPGSVVIDVSSYADPPWCTFSPLWAHGGIPVPGMPGETSDSVEGIWQGLKVIRGRTALRLFKGKGQKRGGKPAGHQFGKRLLGVVEARQKIYQPAYEWVLENRIEPALITELLDTALTGVTQYIHDVGDNGDSNNAHEPLAHAALVVRYLNRRLAALPNLNTTRQSARPRDR